MIDGVNDSDRQADLLAGLLKGMPGHVNLIPLNDVEESPLKPSRRVAAFQKRLESHGAVSYTHLVKVCAQSHDIPVFQPTKLRDGTALAQLQELNPELIVVAAYGRILPDDILAPVSYTHLVQGQGWSADGL